MYNYNCSSVVGIQTVFHIHQNTYPNAQRINSLKTKFQIFYEVSRSKVKEAATTGKGLSFLWQVNPLSALIICVD